MTPTSGKQSQLYHIYSTPFALLIVPASDSLLLVYISYIYIYVNILCKENTYIYIVIIYPLRIPTTSHSLCETPKVRVLPAFRHRSELTEAMPGSWILR